jgi:hypothetical protein
MGGQDGGMKITSVFGDGADIPVERGNVTI